MAFNSSLHVAAVLVKEVRLVFLITLMNGRKETSTWYLQLFLLICKNQASHMY